MCHTVFEANIGLKNNTIFLSCVKASVIGHVGFHCSNASSTIHSIINKHTLPSSDNFMQTDKWRDPQNENGQNQKEITW